ncbi:MAG TPA: hypothetical protein VFT49_01285 [Candidatus Saccharimonadales bacterium]|nr:hypothetical protein [Candidatus Saccharimonadales bacterium]
MNRQHGPEQASGEQISSERLRLHELGQLALSGREQRILEARQTRAARNFVERFHFMEVFGFDPHFGIADSGEEAPENDYKPRLKTTPAVRPLLVAL